MGYWGLWLSRSRAEWGFDGELISNFFEVRLDNEIECITLLALDNNIWGRLGLHDL